MSEQEMARLAQHAKDNPEFLEQFRQDPVNTARDASFTVEEHEAVAMVEVDYSDLDDDDVVKRISMFWMIGP